MVTKSTRQGKHGEPDDVAKMNALEGSVLIWIILFDEFCDDWLRRQLDRGPEMKIQHTSRHWNIPGVICENCERCTWNPGPDCGIKEHLHCPICGHCEGRHSADGPTHYEGITVMNDKGQ